MWNILPDNWPGLFKIESTVKNQKEEKLFQTEKTPKET